MSHDNDIFRVTRLPCSRREKASSGTMRNECWMQMGVCECGSVCDSIVEGSLEFIVCGCAGCDVMAELSA
jgi:hypothetical protein